MMQSAIIAISDGLCEDEIKEESRNESSVFVLTEKKTPKPLLLQKKC